MSGFVYAITDGRGRVKIGWSNDPFRRLAKISSDCPSAASLLGLIPATRKQEAEAHELLRPWRVNREWFLHEGAVIAFVEMLPRPRPKAVFAPKAHDQRLTLWRKANGYTSGAFAELLGVDRVTVHRWENGTRKPAARHLPRIAEITGIPASEMRPDLAGFLRVGT
jgi:DNA-binding transcriptional regulator YiaG